MDILREHEDNISFPCAMLIKHGQKDYVGLVLAVTDNLYFRNSTAPEGRIAVADFFEDYSSVVGDKLKWFLKDEALPVPLAKTQSVRGWLQGIEPDDSAIFVCTGGERGQDASPYQFYSWMKRAWQAARGRDLDVILIFIEEYPTSFQALFLSFARRLKAEHGHGGHGFVLSTTEAHDNQPTEASLAKNLRGFDVGKPGLVAGRVMKGIKTVSWLTAVNNQILEKLDARGGLAELRAELPIDWFATYDYGAGKIIQAGPKPEAASIEVDPLPATYVLPNMLLKPFRSEDIAAFHGETWNGELFLGVGSTREGLNNTPQISDTPHLR